ncbi:Isoflavone 2'-hydroxylase [Heracleum sosnowskyi]|uniref:Isoflavone 2'-hydroxylase n=1 Tax=Heracleum sosnowskyi TaxID=360622 RepID=A0AAD8ND74_9APIA|nr:Isoflavone 2'-hydroxylase [Heracleum sosnowskyi]
MESLSLYLYLPTVLFIIAALYLFSQKSKNLPPSPFPALPMIGHFYLLKKPLHKTLSSFSKKYGPVFYFLYGSRRVLVVSSSAAAEECLTKNDIVFANRPNLIFGKYIGNNFTSIVWVGYGDYWRNLRKLCSQEILSSHRLQKLSSIRIEEAKSMVKNVFKLSDGGLNAVEMRPVFFALLFNVLTRMIAGKRYYGEESGKSEEAKRFQDIMMETARLASVADMGNFTSVLNWFWFRDLENQFVKLSKRRDEFMQNLIDEVRGSGTKGENKTLIQVLLDLNEAKPDYYKDDVIKSLMQTLLQAGVSTSVDSLEWAMSLLLNNPDVLHKAQNEIDNVVGKDGLITESHLPELPYLRYIINETLRMYPVARFLIPHESSDECTIGGFHVPRGTMLLVDVKAIQNDPKIWGDPEIFRPERFQEGNNVGLGFMPFGSGRRKCPGEGLATRVVVLALGALIQCFNWDRIGEEMVDMTEGHGLFAPKVVTLRAKCRARPSMVSLLSEI